MSNCSVYNTLPRGLGIMVTKPDTPRDVVEKGGGRKRVFFAPGNNIVSEEDLELCQKHPIGGAWFQPCPFRLRNGYTLVKRYLVPGHYDDLQAAEGAGSMMRS